MSTSLRQVWQDFGSYDTLNFKTVGLVCWVVCVSHIGRSTSKHPWPMQWSLRSTPRLCKVPVLYNIFVSTPATHSHMQQSGAPFNSSAPSLWNCFKPPFSSDSFTIFLVIKNCLTFFFLSILKHKLQCKTRYSIF